MKTSYRIRAMSILPERIPYYCQGSWSYFFVFSLILLAGCHPGKNRQVDDPVREKIDLTSLWTSEPQEVPLSTIADSIFYIPLETNPKSYLKGDYAYAAKVELLEKHIVIYESYDQAGRIKLFDRAGRYLLTFGRKGKGPGEYLNGQNFACDEKNNRLYLADGNQRKIIMYDLAGRFLREFKTKSLPGELTVSPDHEIGVLYLSFGNPLDTARLEWISPDGNLLRKIPLYQDRLYGKTGAWSEPGFIYWIGDRLRLAEPPFDTIWQLDPDGSMFKAATAIIQGPQGCPREVWFNNRRWTNEASDFYIIARTLENDRLVFLESNGRRFCNFMYNKGTGATQLVRSWSNDERRFDGLVNDLDGGLPFWPSNLSGDYLLTCISYDDIKSYFKGLSMNTINETVNPLLHKRFVQIAGKLDPQSNPVVVVVKMKKQWLNTKNSDINPPPN